MDLLKLEEERQWASRNMRNALIGLDIEDFDNMPLQERVGFYQRHMVSSGFLLITTDEGRYGEAIGLRDITTIFLCRKHMTGRDWLTREARNFYLSNNYFRIHGELVPSFLENCNNHFWDPNGGMDPKQCITKINILLDPQEAIESYGAAPVLLSQIFTLLEGCGEQLQVVVLEVQEQSHEVFTRLLTWRRELEALDRKLELGVLIIEYDAQSTTNLSPRILKLPWKKAEGKQKKVFEAMQDWWYHLRNSEQVDYDIESDNDANHGQVDSR